MPSEPTLQPLPYQHRSWFFRILFAIFVCSVPVFIFYATGYRISMSDTNNIVSVGGIFVSSDAEDTTIFLNDEPVEKYRLFQRAAYIQNLPAGVHNLHVQGEGLHTWVKRLPVYPHIVTEAQAFNYPLVPQVRLITPYTTVGGQSFLRAATSSDWSVVPVETVAPVVASTTIATSTLVANEEFEFVAELFSTSSTSTVDRLRTRSRSEAIETFAFRSEQATTSSSLQVATPTQERNNRRLYETDEGLFVRWVGGENDHPYYFCINTTRPEGATTSVLSLYVAANAASVSDAMETAVTRGDFSCRDEISINTFDRDVSLFGFMPGTNGDVVLVQLTDGLYAVEVDDRGWQNTQLLYPGESITVVVFGEQVFIHDGTHYFELLFTLTE